MEQVATYYKTGSDIGAFSNKWFYAFCEVYDQDKKHMPGHELKGTCSGNWRYCHGKLNKWRKACEKEKLKPL